MTILHHKELTGGYFNAAYSLLLSDGREAVLKVAPLDTAEILTCEHNNMAAEVAVMRLIKARGTVPVPRIYTYDNSRTLIPSEYFVMDKISGDPYNEVKERLSPQTRSRIESELGRYNRFINEIRGSHFGLFPAPRSASGDSWRDTFSGLVNGLLEDARRLGAELPVPAELISAEIAKLLPALDAVTEPRLVHRALWNGNVFVRSGRIVGLIDWERALWGDPLMEYYFRYSEDATHFFRGYGGSLDSPNMAARIKLYDLYTDLIYFIEGYSRKYDSSSHLEWARSNLLEGWNRFTGTGNREIE